METEKRKIKVLVWIAAIAGILITSLLSALWYAVRTEPYHVMKVLGITQDDEERYLMVLRYSYHCGNAEAAFELATIYRNKRKDGGERSLDDSIDLLEYAASKGHIPAMERLALFNYQGSTPGNSQDESQSLSYWTRAADGNSADSMIYLSLCYRDGVGVKRNKETARSLLLQCRKAARVSPDAEFLLSILDRAWDAYSPAKLDRDDALPLSVEENYSPSPSRTSFPAWGPLSYFYGTHRAPLVRSVVLQRDSASQKKNRRGL